MEKERADEELIRRMMADDREAFDQLMESYYPKTLRMAYLISGSLADSEDIVQETFVLCYLNRGKIREPRYFERWLYKTLTREAWRICRRSRREQPVEEVFAENTPGNASVLDEVIKQSGDRELYLAIAGLPAKQRTAVVLYYFNSMSTKEIAGVMGCLEGTVKSRLFTARNNLKEALENDRTWERRQPYETSR